MAIPLVLIFAFITAAMLMSLLFIGTETKNQNKITLYNLQAHYLALSAVQHLKLKLQHMPREVRIAVEPGQPPDTNVFEHIVSSINPIRSVIHFEGGNFDPSYSLFAADAPSDDATPIRGRYEFVSLQADATERRFVHDSFIATVTAAVSCGCGPDPCPRCSRHPNGMPYVVTISERIYLSRD